MGKRYIFPAVAFIFAFGVLFASIFRASAVHYAFSQSPSDIQVSIPEVDYQLPGTGLIGPDDPIWVLEVARDKVWLSLTNDNMQKSELLLLIADKRIAYAEQLAHRKQYAESIVVAQKAEMYLENAYNYLVQEEDAFAVDLCSDLALSALKHRAVLESIYAQAPEDARPLIANQINTPKKIYEYTTHLMNENGVVPVANPFSI